MASTTLLQETPHEGDAREASPVAVGHRSGLGERYSPLLSGIRWQYAGYDSVGTLARYADVGVSSRGVEDTGEQMACKSLARSSTPPLNRKYIIKHISS